MSRVYGPGGYAVSAGMSVYGVGIGLCSFFVQPCFSRLDSVHLLAHQQSEALWLLVAG